MHFFPNFVLGLPGEDGIHFWRQKYSGPTTQEQQTPVLVDIWRNGEFVFRQPFFSQELTNLKGRVLKMATFNYPPYSILGNSYLNLYNFAYKIALNLVGAIFVKIYCA